MSELFVATDIEGILTGPIGNPEVFTRIREARLPGKRTYVHNEAQNSAVISMHAAIADELETVPEAARNWSVTTSEVPAGLAQVNTGLHTDVVQEGAGTVDRTGYAYALFNALPIRVLYVELDGQKSCLDADVRKINKLYSTVKDDVHVDDDTVFELGGNIRYLEAGRWHGIDERSWHSPSINATARPIDRTLIYSY